VIPNEHFTHLENLSIQARDMLGHMVKVASEMADSAGIAKTGYRLVINQRNDAGQMVDHLHLHVLGGGKLGAMG
jgi:histidine triad (HIT) family protein